MSDVKAAYGTWTTLTCTLANLADAGARESNAIDNSSTKYLDFAFQLKTKTGAAAGTLTLFIGILPSYDGGTVWGFDGTGTDSDYTTAFNVYNAGICPFGGSVIFQVGTGASTPYIMQWTYSDMIAQIITSSGFTQKQSVPPPHFSIFVVQNSGDNLDASGANHELRYRGIYATIL